MSAPRHRITVRRDVARERRREYPPVGDQIDAIFKGFRALERQGYELPAETRAWMEALDTVKRRLPKPEGEP